MTQTDAEEYVGPQLICEQQPVSTNPTVQPSDADAAVPRALDTEVPGQKYIMRWNPNTSGIGPADTLSVCAPSPHCVADDGPAAAHNGHQNGMTNRVRPG